MAHILRYPLIRNGNETQVKQTVIQTKWIQENGTQVKKKTFPSKMIHSIQSHTTNSLSSIFNIFESNVMFDKYPCITYREKFDRNFLPHMQLA